MWKYLVVFPDLGCFLNKVMAYFGKLGNYETNKTYTGTIRIS